METPDSSFNFIGKGFKHGANFKIGKFCIIHDDVVVGDNVSIGNYTILHKGTQLGNGTVVGSYCEIGEGVVTQNNVVIQGRIRTGEFCTIEDNVTIKYGTILTSNVLLKKNCFLGPNVITLGSTHKRVTVHGTEIGENTYIGAGSKLGGGVKVGDNIAVGALSFINKDISESGVYVGIPLKKIK